MTPYYKFTGEKNTNRVMAELQLRETSELVDQLKLASGVPAEEDWGKAVFLIGAGCSHSAGIPLAGEIAQGCIVQLASSLSDENFTDRPIEALKWMYDNKKLTNGKYSDDPNWSELYGPIFEDHYRADTQQRAIIIEAIKEGRNRINWSHICLGELVNRGYVHTILTTNFDQLALQGIIYTGLVPVVADGLGAWSRVISNPNTPQVVYLHGSMHTYSLRNSTTAVREVRGQLPMQGMLYQLLRDSQMLVVVGYGGGEEGIMDILIRFADEFENMVIYWATREGSRGSLSNKTERLLSTGHHKFLVEIRDADSLFAEIMEGLGIGVPRWMQDPAIVIERQAQTFAETENIDVRIRIEKYKHEVSLISEYAREERQQESDRDVIAALRLEGKHEEAIVLSREMDDCNDSSIWLMRAESAYELGQTQESMDLFQESVTSWRKALELIDKAEEPSKWAKTQSEFGKTLFSLAELQQQQEFVSDSENSFQDAVKAFKALLRVLKQNRDPMDWAGAQYNLGNVLQALGEIKNNLRFLLSAEKAYQLALDVYTEERAPQLRATTQNNLGGVLQEIGVKKKDSNYLEAAIAMHKDALSGFSRESTPIEWAGAQDNLASTYRVLHSLTDVDEQLDRSVEAYEAAAAAYDEAGEEGLAGEAKVLAEEVRRILDPNEAG